MDCKFKKNVFEIRPVSFVSKVFFLEKFENNCIFVIFRKSSYEAQLNPGPIQLAQPVRGSAQPVRGSAQPPFYNCLVFVEKKVFTRVRSTQTC